LDPWLQQLWRRSVAKRWLWGARTIQRGWRRELRRGRGRALAAARKWLGPASRVADSLAGLAVADATNPSLLPD
jgi:hypothetical protein